MTSCNGNMVSASVASWNIRWLGCTIILSRPKKNGESRMDCRTKVVIIVAGKGQTNDCDRMGMTLAKLKLSGRGRGRTSWTWTWTAK